jgi:hypothetical protein
VERKEIVFAEFIPKSCSRKYIYIYIYICFCSLQPLIYTFKLLLLSYAFSPAVMELERQHLGKFYFKFLNYHVF